MCGIAGEIRFDGRKSDLSVTKAMCEAQIHRGPDDEGYYANGPVSLGIRRLAIIDLTKGLYPLHNEENTVHLVFNGEVYGFDALRDDLKQRGHTFVSGTDAETLVHSYEEWGTACLHRLNGMFAFALWDEKEQTLWIARDHFGIKPLYYHRSKEFLTFASEIKPILIRPDLPRSPDEHTIREYLSRARVDDTQRTFFEGIQRVLPAQQLLVFLNGTVRNERYWSPNISREIDGSSSPAEVARTRELFLESVRKQLVSDVPVGTCLSGGIDSSSVVCAVRQVHPRGTASTGELIKTFSAIFPGYPIDESEYVRTVCDATRAEYNPVCPTAAELWQDLRDLVRCQEEPFASTSVYAQYRVMRRAKERGITVLLDGQGSDELLCGYVPLYLHYLITLVRHREYGRAMSEAILSLDLLSPLVRPQIHNYAKMLLARLWSTITRGRLHNSSAQAGADSKGDLPFALEALTTGHGLPALLRYEDKNSMWHSIEARVPFLDRPFFEYVAGLPLDRKLRDGWTKYVFRLAMSGILPDKIRLRRSKIGFETPEKKWMEVELRELLQVFFSKPSLFASRFCNVDAIRRILKEGHGLAAEQASLVWRVLNLELWYREFFTDESVARIAGLG